MSQPLSLKILRRLHDGEDHRVRECLEDSKPPRRLMGQQSYFPWKSKAYFLRQEDDC